MSEKSNDPIPLVRKMAPDGVVAEAGGLVDKTAVTLAIYGESLVPEELSQRLGVVPTSSHRRGDSPNPGVRPYAVGGWFHELRGTDRGPRELIGDLLGALPPSESRLWVELRREFDVRLTFGLFLAAWNRGFGLDAPQLEQLSAMVSRVEFDIYANADRGHA